MAVVDMILDIVVMELDIVYAEKSSFLFDLGIMFKTVPALFQKENV